MSCFPCFTSQKSKKDRDSPPHENITRSTSIDGRRTRPPPPAFAEPKSNDAGDKANIKSQNFTFRELAAATKNFRQECLLAESGFGRVYRGTLPGSGQVVAVKQLDCTSMQHGSKEFLAEVSALSLLDHENLIKLIGYCADGDQRLLVYEYMAGGPLEDHLLDLRPDKKPLDWMMRIKLALGAARGLEYLHDCADPPIIYRHMKASSILLDGDLNPKLSDFGLANIAPSNDKFHGYCAPENRGIACDFTIKSDVYSFGVVLLELISGRRAIDTTKPTEEQILVTWAQPKFRDPKLYPQLADPLLRNKFNDVSLNQLVAIAAMCVQEEASVRPFMGDVVTALTFLMAAPANVSPHNLPKLLSVASWDLGSCIRRDGIGSSDRNSSSESGSSSDGNKSKNRNVSHKGSLGSQRKHKTESSSSKKSRKSSHGSPDSLGKSSSRASSAAHDDDSSSDDGSVCSGHHHDQEHDHEHEHEEEHDHEHEEAEWWPELPSLSV